MRYALVLACLACAAEASGAMLFLNETRRFHFEAFSTPDDDEIDIQPDDLAPATFWVEFEEGAETVRLDIPNVSPADEGMVWQIDPTNAADFGLDWLAFQEIAGSDATEIAYWGVETPYGSKQALWATFLEFSKPIVDRLEVEVSMFRNSFLVGNDPLIEMSVRVVGTATVPEPNALVLLLAGLCCCHHTAHCRK